MNIHWEITFLLTLLPIYLIGTAVVIFLQLPIRLRPLAQVSPDGSIVTGSDSRLRLSSNGILISGFILHSLIIVIRGLRAGHFPVTSIYETLLFFSWILVGLSVLFSISRKIPIINVGALPVAVILILMAVTQIQDVDALAPALQSYWLTIHVGFAFLSYAAYTLAFIVGVFYIILERQMKKKKFGVLYQLLPSLEILDETNYYAVAIGFILLTIGIITGAVWANETWGRYWGWDPKETWSLITWFLYAILLHVRITSQMRGRKVAYLSILGFGFVIFTYLGVGILWNGLHSYLVK